LYFFDRLQATPSYFKVLQPFFHLSRHSATFGFAQFVSFHSSSFVHLLSLASTVFDVLQASFGLLLPSATFSDSRIQFDSMISFRSRSFFDLLSLLISTVFDEELHIGNSDRIDNEDEIGRVSE
jgi:hypothetical protein